MSTEPYRGRVQAQGDDIDIDKKGGYSQAWAQDIPVTDKQGLDFLDKIEGKCNKSQKAQRKQAFAKARNFVRCASESNGIKPEAQPHSFQDRKRTIPNARVDIEIHAGLTFIPEEKKDD